MERKWIVCAFVDIRGFGTWIYRASIPKEVKEPFICDYLEIVQEYVLNNKDVQVKYLGDGFMATKEFGSVRATDIFEFVKGIQGVTNKIGRLTKKCDYPLDGVRARISEGYVYKIMVIDTFDESRVRLIPEYIEYCINTAERLMEVNPEITCLVTEGVGKALGSKRSAFRMRKLGAPSCYPRSVNKEDLETLEVLKF